MRAIWKGHLRFSLVTIPIQLFSAVEQSSQISFKQLHKEDHGSIKYKRVCESCNEEVEYKEIVKGYEYQENQYVVLSKKDLKSIKLKSNKAIDIESFVDINEVSPSRFEAVYFIGPSGDIAQAPYKLLVEALKKTNKVGVGRIVLRDKEDVCLVAFEGNGLIMYKMRYPEELRSVDDIPGIETADVEAAQLALAETLINTLTTSFDQIDFHDAYKASIEELVKKKIEGKQVVTLSEPEEIAPVVDIMDALKKSIESTKAK